MAKKGYMAEINLELPRRDSGPQKAIQIKWLQLEAHEMLIFHHSPARNRGMVERG